MTVPPAAAPPVRFPIAVTMGDAAGVGPELCARLLGQESWPENSFPVILGQAALLKHLAQTLRLDLKTPVFTAWPEQLDGPFILDLPGLLDGAAVTPGRHQMACGRAAARCIEEAVQACQRGRCAAMVTAPISKHALHLAGIHYPGHTEMIADLVGCSRHAMLLYSEKLAVAFVTGHRSLQSVAQTMRPERILEVAVLLNQHLRLLRNLKTPRLAVLALNPHASESGLFGREEEDIITPAVRQLHTLGLQVDGPLAADTAFTPQSLALYDGHVALYHDQGCIPFKMACFDSGVNVTMGLEIIRTSPDHGTAFDIAWQGLARPESFFSAYALAARLAASRRGDARRAALSASPAARRN